MTSKCSECIREHMEVRGFGQPSACSAAQTDIRACRHTHHKSSTDLRSHKQEKQKRFKCNHLKKTKTDRNPENVKPERLKCKMTADWIFVEDIIVIKSHTLPPVMASFHGFHWNT